MANYLRLLVLLMVANGAPIVAKYLLGELFAVPLDGGLRLPDGGPLFGSSKTLRGIFVSLAATALTAPLLGIVWSLGLLIAAAAMAGDLLSSFLKRRLKFPISSMAIGLDQLPEALFPALLCWRALSLTWLDVAAVVLSFLICELLLSQLLFRLHVRDRPY